MLKNITKNIILSEKVDYCKSITSKARGLMFTRKKNRALVFLFDKEQKISIHMFFVFYPIDVLWLDKNKKVVQLKENLMPFLICKAQKNAQYLVELPAGIISRTKTSIEDTISFK
jgi:uncharacterized protein